MSSVYVRSQIFSFLKTKAPNESVVDLTSDYEEFKELLADFDVQPDSPWLGVQFIGFDEEPVTLPATNVSGKYRETGGIYFHVCDVARLGNGDGLLTRGEILRKLMRGQRIGGVVINSVSPLNTDRGATLDFKGGYMSGSFIMAYQYDFDL